MTTAATSLLGLALPVTGELSGTWGDTVNNSITSLLDTAIAGTTTLSTDGDVTLSTTTLAANQARQAILLCSGARTAIRTITAPAQSKIYTIINATTGGYAVKIVGVGPTTGISIPAGQTATVAWNGSDFVDASNYVNGNKVINGNLSVTGSVTLSGGTANGVAYLNGSKVLTTGSALVFDGTNLGLGVTPSAFTAGRAMEVAYVGNALWGTGAGDFSMVANVKYNGALQYANSSIGANRFEAANGAYYWYSASGSGKTAGDPITFTQAMTLDASGNLIVGNTSVTSGARFQVDNPNANVIASVGKDIPVSLFSRYNDNPALYWKTGNALRFAVTTDGVGTSGFTEYARIDSSGTFRVKGAGTAGSTDAVQFSGSAPASSLLLDTSGNLGLGVTANSWVSGWRALALGGSTGIGGTLYCNAGGTTGQISIAQNWYYDGTNNKYITSSYASDYTQYQGQHRWSTAASGTAGGNFTFTQAMTLDASGNLVVGRTSGLGTARANFAGANTVSDSWGQVAVITTDNFAIDKGGQLVLGGAYNAGGSMVNYASIAGRKENSTDGNAAGYLAFTTSTSAGVGTERARIDSSGNLLVGVTSISGNIYGSNTGRLFASSPSAGFAAGFRNSSASGTIYGVGIQYTGQSPNGTGNEFLLCEDSGPTLRASIRSNGGIANYSANDVNLSDRREKTNFSPAGEYLSKICAIPVQTFNYIDQNLEEDPGLTLGVAAQDVQAVAPELVMESNWGSKENPKMRLSIYQTDLQYALMKCIQEQQALITQLTERITALESK